MRRLASLALLLLPTLLVAGWVGAIVAERARLPVHRIALVGVDPRDLLRGHYLVARLDLTLSADQAAPAPPVTGDEDAAPEVLPFPDFPPCACVEDNRADPLRPVARPLESCQPEQLRQCPRPLLAPGQIFHLYVPEERAAALEAMIRDGGGTVTTGVRFTGTGAVLLDGVEAIPK